MFTVTTTGTKGRTLESCIVYLCNLEDRHISQGQENISMWYDGPRIHPSLLDLVIISPFLALTHTHEPWYAAFKMCCYRAPFVSHVQETQQLERYCHLLTRKLASFKVRQLIEGPTCRCISFICISLVDAFKLYAL